jgi:Ion channel
VPPRALVPSKAFLAAKKRLRHYSTLLVAELAFILGYPFVAETAAHDELFRLLAVAIFCATLYAVLGRGRITLVAFILGVPAIVVHVANVIGPFGHLQIASMALGIVFLVFVTSVFIWAIVSNPSVTADTLAGAVSAYMLVGITYGLAYGLIERVAPGSFRDTVDPAKHFHPSEFVFFSFITLTTVGYGDIIPWSAHARSLAIVESVTGIMYPAVLIGRLVGGHVGKRSESELQ